MDREVRRMTEFRFDKTGEYYTCKGVQVMSFHDFYPAGHQSGVSIIMHGKRVATNGDVRFEPTPGQWQPVPKQLERQVDKESGTIVTTLCYPDPDAHLKGFNPIVYPDFAFTYRVRTRAEGNAVFVTVDLDREIPKEYIGKLHFILELYPGELFGKPWIMDDKQGIFPRQANGPVFFRESGYGKPGHFEGVEEQVSPEELAAGLAPGEYSPIVADDILGVPYGEGHRFTVRPEDPYSRFTVESTRAKLSLYDGRFNHNNGWFVLASELPGGVKENALTWKIMPNVVKEWVYPPVVQVSQVGYHPDQSKVAVVEADPEDGSEKEIVLVRYTENGPEEVLKKPAKPWGKFLRYFYHTFDFTEVTAEGLYSVFCRREGGQDAQSAIFRIARDVYDRGVWQPVLEYFLPVQMCHMAVRDKYRLWHGLCHRDDAKMAPVSRCHFDGYRQGPSTLTKFKSGDHVPGLNVGGWHDAGDFDLRVESQSGEAYILALTYEAFGVYLDSTTIDQKRQVVEIHLPDGQNDLLQQIEHGALSVVNGYKALGRLYRGVICRTLRQYVLQGDPAGMTGGMIGDADDRLVFTEDNPPRELSTAAHLAAVARALKGFRGELAAEALRIAEEIFDSTRAEEEHARACRIHAAAELMLTTGDEKYRKVLLENREEITTNFKWLGWIGARVMKAVGDEAFTRSMRQAAELYRRELDGMIRENPYGIPYHPVIYGAGWMIQGFAFHYYFLRRTFSDLFGRELLENALNFILGCHPGLNTASFASGVGARSMTVAYGINRADWSYVPGGVVSGTALIQPDFPELLDFPYLWQQAEYVLGGGSSHYMFLVLAVMRELGCEIGQTPENATGVQKPEQATGPVDK